MKSISVERIRAISPAAIVREKLATFDIRFRLPYEAVSSAVQTFGHVIAYRNSCVKPYYRVGVRRQVNLKKEENIKNK